MNLFRKFKSKFSKIALSFSLLLGALTGIVGVSGVGYAASREAVSGFNVPNCGLSCEWSTGLSVGAEHEKSYSPTNQTLETTVKSGTTSATLTFTFTNNYPSNAVLSFTVQTLENKGEVKFDGKNCSKGANYSKELSSKGTVALVVKASSSWLNPQSTKVVLFGISLAPLYYNTTFEVSPGGEYSVNGKKQTEKSIRKDKQVYTLNATPETGYVFSGWVRDGSLLSKNNPYNYVATKDSTINPTFSLIQNASLFKVGTNYFSSLTAAINAANTSSNKTIVANLADTPVVAGDYVVPSGITLLVPFDANDSVILPGDENLLKKDNATNVLFRNLILMPGCNITFQGSSTLYVGSIVYAVSYGKTSCPVGPYGMITTSENSSITMGSGSTLYCFGFINGSGVVTAEAGSTVYELFQLTNYRGGGYTNEIVGDDTKPKVFPFNQYYVQNIECALRIEKGASEKVFGAIYTNGWKGIGAQYLTAQFTFIGDGGLFVLSSGYCEKKYHPETDRVEIRIHGDGKISNIVINFKGITEIKTAEYVLPISNCYDLILENGTVTTEQDFSLIPGATLTLNKGSTFELNNRLFVHSSSDWKGKPYVSGTAWTVPVAYTPENGTKSPRDGKDPGMAQLNVLGSLQIASNGYLYVSNQTDALVVSKTDSGAVGTGKIEFLGRNETGSETSIERQYSKGTHESGSLTYEVEYAEMTVYTSWHEEVSQNQKMSYDLEKNKWLARGLSFVFVAADSTKTYTIDVQSGGAFNLPSLDTVSTVLNIASLYFWIDENGVSHDLTEKINASKYPNGQTFTAFTDGWITRSSKTYFYDAVLGKVTGIYQTYASDNRNLLKTFLFDSDGVLQTSFTGVETNSLDGQLYYFENGVAMPDKGLIKIKDSSSDSYYFFGENGYAYKSGTYHLSSDKLNGYFAEGSFTFDANGVLTSFTSDASFSLGEGGSLSNNAFTLDGVKAGVGLFTLSNDSHVYYAKDDGSLAKNETVYVSKTNGIKDSSGNAIEEGLYWFDGSGYMFDASYQTMQKGA